MKRLRIPFAILMAVIMTLSFLPSVFADQAAPVVDPPASTGTDVPIAPDESTKADPPATSVAPEGTVTPPDTTPANSTAPTDAEPSGNGLWPKIVFHYNWPNDLDDEIYKSFEKTDLADLFVTSQEVSQPKLDGYIFSGWMKTAKGPNIALKGTYKAWYPLIGTDHYYAYWEKDTTTPIQIKITYKPGASDASISPDRTTEALDAPSESFNLPTEDQHPTRDNWDFTGWEANWNADGTGGTTFYPVTDETATGPKTAGIDYTLTAMWEQPTPPTNICITYAAGDAGENAQNIPIGEQSAELGVPFPLLGFGELKPVWENYTFVGWKASWNGTTYETAGPHTINVEQTSYTLTAQWKHEEGKWVEVSYISSESVKDMSTLPITHRVLFTDKEFSIPADMTSSEKEFKGWDVVETIKAERYLVGDEVSLLADQCEMTLSAQWDSFAEITIAYDDGVADEAISKTITEMPTNPITLKSNEKFGIPQESKPLRLGHDFLGWNPDWTDVASPYYQPGASNIAAPTSTAPYKLIAVWARKPDMYEVTYKPGDTAGATVNGTPAPMYVDNGQSHTVTTTKPQCSGYTFKNWLFSASPVPSSFTNGNIYYESGKPILNIDGNPDYTLTAQWTKNPSGPSDPSGPSYPDYDDEYTIDANCSSGGYIYHEGRRTVDRGNDLTVTWAPRTGYSIDAVYIDGRLNNNYDGSYTFSNITSDHSIYVEYTRGSGSWDDNDSPQTEDTSMPMWLLLSIGAAAATLIVAANKRAKA